MDSTDNAPVTGEPKAARPSRETILGKIFDLADKVDRLDSDLRFATQRINLVLQELKRLQPPEPEISIKPDMLTAAEFAAEVGRSKDWVSDQIRRRRIKPARIGKPYRIPRSELNRLLEG